MMGLTQRQADCLLVLKDLTVEGRAPTYAEIAERLGLEGKSGVHRLLVALEERGLIRRIPRRSRAIEIMSTTIPGRSTKQISDEICRIVWEWTGRTRTTDQLAPLIERVLL